MMRHISAPHPRAAYRLDDGRYLVCGHRVYHIDGEPKQSAAIADDLDEALRLVEQHEAKERGIHAGTTSRNAG